MSFEKHSNFNKLANFSEVKFGENKPVLEVELNEMQQIQNEARADIIRDTMPSGFVTLGDIDYEHCANNNNQIKLSTESIAYVNGYRITIPRDTIIEIGEADKVREDLVFLEVWKEAVTDIDELKRYGGEGNAVIDNPIKDERYPVATSQRVQLKYRIRHVSDVDFTTNYDGLEYQAYSNGTNKPSKAKPQGGNATPLTSESYNLNFFRGHLIPPKNVEVLNRKQFTGDLGLYVAGVGDSSKKPLKTMDGYVYAIPMFRLVRKPNVGLASPFEYKKIHNQLDPKKFAHLVGQENVEKVHSVNIKGKTFKNLITHAKQQGNGAFNVTVSPDIVTFDTNASWGKIGFLVKGEPDTKYIFHCSDFYKGEKSVEFYVRFSDSIHAPAQTLNKIDSNTYTFTTDSSGVFMFSFEISGGVSKAYVKYPILMKYSEWEEQLRGKAIAGVKSLGETNNNSITIENNLVEEGTYVHELQNHILPTHPEVTHVTWGEDVVIPPEVEIELKNGEEVIQTITQLPVKLETTGEEKLHVKTMKGQTLVNVNRSNFVVNSAITGDYGNAISKFDTDMKASTTYTVIAYSDNQYEYRLSEMRNTTEVALNNDRPLTVGVPTVFTTNENFTSLRGYLKGNTLNIPQGTEIKILIIEGDHSNENIPYFEGMQSVNMPVLKTTGKNLLSFPNEYERKVIEGRNCVIINTYTPNINYKANTQYTVRGVMKYQNGYASQIKITYTDGTNTESIFSTTSFSNYQITSSPNKTIESITFKQNVHDQSIKCIVCDIDTMMIEEGTQATSYEPYKSNILSTPSDLELRRIGDVKDELNYLTGEVTERIREDVINGSEIWNRAYVKTNTMIFYTTNTNPYAKRFTNQNLGGEVLCAEFSHSAINIGNSSSDIEGIYTAFDGNLCLSINKSKLSTENVDGLKSWLSQNPITVQYLLETPITKKIGLSENDYVGKSKVTYQLAEPLRKVGTYSDFIKGKTLYSNIGVEVLNGSENIVQRGETLENTLLFVTYLTNINIKSDLIYSDKFDGTVISWDEIVNADKEFIRLYTNDTNALYIRILKSKLATQDVNGFKQWLQANPVTIYYVKANPVEIPLKEVSPLECDFSINRQFKRGYENYLKELPNGVKDVVENGKVKRNVKHLVVNGTENWTTLSTDGDTVRAFMMLSGAKPLAPTFNSYDFTHGTAQTDMNILGVDQNGNLVIGILKTLLTSPDVQGIKEYLSRKNLHVIYELQTPTTEELTEENSRYVPYMPLNSYVGSLYVADGINQTKFLTDFSPSEYEVQTYHRYFSNEFNMFEDIKRKKSPYGYKTYLEEVDGKYVEKFIAGLEKHEIEDLRHKVSLTGFDYSQLLQDSFLKLIKGELS